MTQADGHALVRARTLLGLNRPADAAEVARRALQDRPDDADLHALLAHALLDLDRYDDARRSAERALTYDPVHTEALSVLAAAFAGRKDTVSAMHVVDRLVATAPAWAEAHLQRARILVAAGDLPAAEGAARYALHLAPGSADARALLGLVLFRMLDRHGARGYIEEALRIDPENRLAHTVLGYLQLQGGAERESADRFQQALLRDPSDRGARLGMGMAIKARNPVYRALLRFQIWTRHQPGLIQLVIRASPFLVVRLALAVNTPPVTPVLLVLAAIFIVVSWSIDPVLTLSMLCSRRDRVWVERNQRTSALVFLAFALGSAIDFVYYAAAGHSAMVVGGFGLAMWAFVAGWVDSRSARFRTVFYRLAAGVAAVAVACLAATAAGQSGAALACAVVVMVSGILVFFSRLASREPVVRRAKGSYRG